jgi:V8-like Glu-specific endopeptidase
MKTITRLLMLLVGLASLTFGQPAKGEITEAVRETVVRIIRLDPDPKDPNFPVVDTYHLTDSDTYYSYNWALGTGFPINQNGYVLTNNHVVADKSLSGESTKLIFILQKSGEQFFLHRGIVEKQDPNADAAIVHVPTLKALPLDFAPNEPKEAEDVFSIGFPGTADRSVIRGDREERIAEEYKAVMVKAVELYIQKQIDQQTTEYIQKNGGKQPAPGLIAEWRDALRKKLIPQIEARAQSIVLLGDAELGDLLHAFETKIRANPSAGYWDVTDVMNQGLRRGYITPTVTKGNAEKITEKPGWLEDSITIPVIQHNLHIMHGNSGGPLLNGGGQIVGIVGRGFGVSGNGESENIDYATTGKFLIDMLQTRHIAFTVGSVWNPNPPQIWVVVAVSIAIAVAIAALVAILINARRKTGFTKLIEALKAKGASGGTQILRELIGGKSKIQNSSSARSSIVQAPGTGNWKLDGRTSNGKTFQIPISDTMFSNKDSRLVLGRSPELCDLVVEDETVSRQHAEIRKNGGGFVVADRNSSNGTAVNGVFNRKPFDPVPFKPGDTLTVGEVKLTLR